MTATATPSPLTVTDERNCAACDWCSTPGDAYCEKCGFMLFDCYDVILRWCGPPGLRTTPAPTYGAGLAREVRKLVKKLGCTVRTDRGYRVRVEMPTPHYDELVKDINEYTAQGMRGFTAREIRDRRNNAARHLERTLHALYPGTAGKVDDGIGADYHWLILPTLSVN